VWKDMPSTAGGVVLKDCNLMEEAEVLERDGVRLVQQELESHGLGFEMHMLDSVVPTKRLHPRFLEAHASRPDYHCTEEQHRMMKRRCSELKERPVLDVELFAGLLYTGTDAQGQIRAALRAPATDLSMANGWKWTITALRHLIIKLAEKPPDWLFHGLNNVKPPSKDSAYTFSQDPWVGYNNIVSGSMSLDMGRTFAKGEGGTVSNPSKFGLVLHMNMAKSPSIIAADMRWLSKFKDEQEWLLMPLLHKYEGLYLTDSRSEPLPNGGELTHQECVWDV